MKYDFDDDLRGPDPRAFPFFTETRKRSDSLLSRNSGRKTAAHFSWNCSADRLHLLVMAGLGMAAALLTGFIFFCFAWSVLTL